LRANKSNACGRAAHNWQPALHTFSRHPRRVIPAKAGTHVGVKKINQLVAGAARPLDSRLRGNDIFFVLCAEIPAAQFSLENHQNCAAGILVM
jgi:hypothetical protein